MKMIFSLWLGDGCRIGMSILQYNQFNYSWFPFVGMENRYIVIVTVVAETAQHNHKDVLLRTASVKAK